MCRHVIRDVKERESSCVDTGCFDDSIVLCG